MNFGVADSASSRAKARTRISALDAQILELEIALGALRHERKAFGDQLDSYVYPVLELPNEIVSEIFTHFLPAYPKYPPLVGIHSPSILGQICRKWREIAVSTPSLWCTIALAQFRNRRHAAIQLRLLEIWLRRSRVSPLSISLEYYEEEDDILPIIDAIVSHSFRWEAIELHLPLPHLLLCLSLDMPLLHTLDVDLSNECVDGTAPIILFDQAPNLTTVTLHPTFNPFHLILPWSQLTTLHGKCLLEHELGEILRLAVNLDFCSTVVMRSPDDVAIPILAPHLHLRDLILISDDSLCPAANMRIFRQLRFPALRRLEIPELWLCPSLDAPITGWIFRSEYLESVHITFAAVSEILYRRALPSVRELHIDESGGF
ncbi:hypothetical protein DFH09DRAFT_1418826 [Mycena vulgaris]|nr:hypothetical protein DFH09DRAFT_1418826 [Mycena vulgaris]